MPFDPMDLTVNEVEIANRKLGGDALAALAEGGKDRWSAAALLAWLHAKRDDPAASLDTFRGMSLNALVALMTTDDDTADDGSDPTDPAP
jgi:hypothetical protein